LSQGLTVTSIGIVIGLCLAGAGSRVVAGQLFAVKALDPAIYADSSLIMIVVAVFACGMPALRAARLDPATTLRHD
jgi:putative ABC transport system permease protein